MNPYMLAALAALSIPWIIEWLFRRKRRRVELPTIRFLLNTDQQTKVRFQDLLLLLLRTIVIFVFVLVLVRPILRPDPLLASGDKTLHVVMVFDATYSNAQKVGADSAFALARKTGSEVVAALPRSAEVTLAVLTDRATVIMDRSRDLPAVREHIEQLTVGDTGGHMIDALDWVRTYQADRKLAGIEIYIFSDMQQSTWAKRPDDSRDPRTVFRKLCDKNRVFIADTGGERTTNFYLTKFEPADRVMAAGIPVTFNVTAAATNVRGAGTNRAGLTFYVDGKRQDAQAFVLGEAPHRATFQYTFFHGGTYLVKAVLRNDGHTIDNARYYLATVPEAQRVLIVDSRAKRARLERDSGLLAAAVSPPRGAGRDKVSAFLATVRTPDELSLENLSDYRVIILTNLSALPSQMVSALESFVAEGGSLMVTLGDAVVPFECNRKLYRDGRGLLPCAIKETGGPVTGQALALEFDAPVKSTVDAAATSYMRLKPPPVGQGMTTLARFTDGSPALVEKMFGRGRVLLFAGSVGPGWGELPLTNRFPVLVQQLLRHLVGSTGLGVNIETGGVFDQPVLMTSRHLTLRRPDGGKARLTPIRREGHAIRRVRYADTDRTGLYEVDTIPEVLAERRFVFARF